MKESKAGRAVGPLAEYWAEKVIQLRRVRIFGIILIMMAGGLMQSEGNDSFVNIDAAAEELFKSGSYERALQRYQAVDQSVLTDEEKLWVSFRVIDSTWRSKAATSQRDNLWVQAAIKGLENILEGDDESDGQRYIRAFAAESMGDLRSRTSGPWNRGEWGSFYEQALRYWAGTAPGDATRNKYISIARKYIQPTPPNRESGMNAFRFRGDPSVLSEEILNNVLKIATDDEDTAWFTIIYSQVLRSRSSASDLDKAFRYLDRAVDKVGAGLWHWRLLLTRADLLTSPGIPVRQDDGSWGFSHDYQKAVSDLEYVVRNDRNNETGMVEDAKRKIDEIRKPEINVSVPHFFKPDQTVSFGFNFRNLEDAQVSIRKIDLTERVDTGNEMVNQSSIADRLKGRGPIVYSADFTNTEFRSHTPHGEVIRLESGLPIGAYSISAVSGQQRTNELLIVTSALVQSRNHGEGVSLLVTDAESGAPIEGARIQLLRGLRGRNDWSYRSYNFKSDVDGLVRLNERNVDSLSRSQFFVVGETDRGPVILFESGSFYGSRLDAEVLKYYAYTDRPAYRPGDTIHWKVTARDPDGGDYKLPSGKSIEFQIMSPRGEKVSDGTLTLNSYGSGTGELVLDDQAALGAYRIMFRQPGEKYWPANTNLFRLEEYKLPEFFVTIEVPKPDVGTAAYRPGDRIAANVNATYYFGAPVADAEVEVVVRRSGWNYPWIESFPYAWMGAGISQRGMISPFPRRQSGGEEILRTTLKTDATGQARVEFASENLEPGQDYQFTIEATVTDSSRVAIQGSGAVTVTEKPYFVSVERDHAIHKPGDPIRLTWKFRDANENPVSTSGHIQVALQKIVERPTPIQPRDNRGGRPAFEPEPGKEYEYEILEMIPADIAANGEFISTWRPEKKGYYRFKWIGKDLPAYLDTNTSIGVFVLGQDQESLGYRSGGIEIILDKKSAESGEEFSFVLAPSKPAGFVWLGYEIGDKWQEEIVRIDGNARVVRFQVGADIARNFFIHASLVRDYELFSDRAEVIVPPTHKLLKMEMTASKEEYLPGASASWKIRVVDQDGKPVEGEMSFAVYDKSVEAIQQDTTQSIEAFFYGNKYYSSLRQGSMLSVSRFRVEPMEEESLAEMAMAGVFFKTQTASVRSARFGVNSLADSPMPEMAMAMAADGAALGIDPGLSDAPVRIRSDFRDSAYWNGTIRTDSKGEAVVDFLLPDSLTTWKAVGRFIDGRTAVAQSESEVIARNPLSVRVEVPRFMISGDEALLTAVVLNQTDTARDVRVNWDIAGGISASSGDANAARTARIQPGGESVFELKVLAGAAAEASVQVSVRSEDFSDGLRRTFPVMDHGMEKLVYLSGKQTSGNIRERFVLPEARRNGTENVVVRVTPSMAVTMLDALPYLINYPYGCVEQTMSRFVPAVVVSNTLTEMGIAADDIQGYVKGGIEASFRTSGKLRESVGFEKLEDVTRQSLDRLYDFQKPGGGWGWWKNSSEDVYMSAYVLWGLALAQKSGIQVDRAAIERGHNFLVNSLGRLHNQPDILVWVLRSLAVSRPYVLENIRLHENEVTAFDIAWKNHTELKAYTRALLAVVAFHHGHKDRAELLVRNLENGVIRLDDRSGINPGTGNAGPRMVRWGGDGIAYRWSDSPIETTSAAIEAMTLINPQHELLDPAVNWLLAQRRAASWTNTRDTAIAVMALAGYVSSRGELIHPLDVKVKVNGFTIGELSFDQKSILRGPAAVEVPASLVSRGNIFDISIERGESPAPVYYNIEARYYSLEKPIQPAGNSLFVRRSVQKLEPYQTLLEGIKHREQPLGDLPKTTSGDKIRVRLMVEAITDLEYILIEDFKPACLEFDQVRSGYGVRLYPIQKNRRGEWVRVPGRSVWTHTEWRDNRSAIFIDRLPVGTWELEYDARVQVPGNFHALPTIGSAMYVPEIQGNSLEHIWSARD